MAEDKKFKNNAYISEAVQVTNHMLLICNSMDNAIFGCSARAWPSTTLDTTTSLSGILKLWHVATHNKLQAVQIYVWMRFKISVPPLTITSRLLVKFKQGAQRPIMHSISYRRFRAQKTRWRNNALSTWIWAYSAKIVNRSFAQQN